MEKLKGKKLLVLGGKPINTYEIVKYAKSKGVYTIVTDYLPKDKSKAKQLADEAWDISTADVEQLEEKIKECAIDGIYAGVHEFNLTKVLELCERTHKPFYATREQWEYSTDKQIFKQKCKKVGLPTAKDFDINHIEDVEYPVIVKPVDGSAGKGVTICYNEEELKSAYDYAMSCSNKKEVIIEEYLYGDEVVVFYTIINGEARLSVMSDYYYNYDQKQTMPLPQIYMYPSVYLDEYENNVDSLAKLYIKEMGFRNGTFFLQAFKNDRGFFFFEPGYRPGGSSVYKYTELLNGISYIEMLVNYSLLGTVGDIDINLENPHFSKPCCTCSLVSKGGVIKHIEGYEDVCQIEEVIDSELRYNVGDKVPPKSALGQIVMRFFLVADTIKRLKEIIVIIQDKIKLIGEDGDNILIPPFDVRRIKYE